MSTKHTPIDITERLSRYADLSIAHARRPLTDAEADEYRAIERRIVACVNACEGFSTEELNDDILTSTTWLKRQRDELLAAADLVQRAWVGDGVDMASAVDAILLTIAKVTGK